MNRQKTADMCACLDAHTSSFCSVEAGQHYRRYTDDKLPDMYYHNLLILEPGLDMALAEQLICAELAQRQAAGKTFCLVQLMLAAGQEIGQLKLPLKPEITHHIICVSENPVALKIGGNRDCTIRQITSPTQVEDHLTVSLPLASNEDFGRRRGHRDTEVYLQPGGVDGFLCYDQGQPVGGAELIVHEDWGMIENLDVIPAARHRGFGTAILRELVAEALRRGARNILLDTDAADTPKEMYRNLGFVHHPGRSTLFFTWDQ